MRRQLKLSLPTTAIFHPGYTTASLSDTAAIVAQFCTFFCRLFSIEYVDCAPLPMLLWLTLKPNFCRPISNSLKFPSSTSDDWFGNVRSLGMGLKQSCSVVSDFFVRISRPRQASLPLTLASSTGVGLPFSSRSLPRSGVLNLPHWQADYYLRSSVPAIVHKYEKY